MKNGHECSPVNMITHLPDDLVLNCLARVSRLYYPILSLVSKRLCSLIASLELYQTRTLLCNNESCLYICLRFSYGCNSRWFTLCRRPARTPKHNPRWFTPCFRPHTKEEKRPSNNLMALVPRKCILYKPKENKWDLVGLDIHLVGAYCKFSCVINNVIYSFKQSKVLKWYDYEVRLWRDLTGLEELPKLPKSFGRVRLMNYGGKIAVLWEKSGLFSREKMIWCAVIAVEKCNRQEIYGKIEWCDVVLTVPKSCCLLEFLAVTV